MAGLGNLRKGCTRQFLTANNLSPPVQKGKEKPFLLFIGIISTLEKQRKDNIPSLLNDAKSQLQGPSFNCCEIRDVLKANTFHGWYQL